MVLSLSKSQKLEGLQKLEKVPEKKMAGSRWFSVVTFNTFMIHDSSVPTAHYSLHNDCSTSTGTSTGIRC